MRNYLPYFILALPFLLLKLTNMGIWLSDTNIYFYTGYQLLQGKILYKDIFFTNLPLMPYLSAVYFLFTFGDIPAFFLTASLEAIIVGFLVYFITYKQTKTVLTALLASALYLYSFIVLTTSNHQTGVFLASIFASLAYLFFTRQRFTLSGGMIALSLLTKAYFLPIFLSLLFAIFLQNKRYLASYLIGFLITSFILLLPSLLLSPSDFYKDVLVYSLTRSQGIPKEGIVRFFFMHDFLFVAILIWNIITFHKYLFFGLVSLFGTLFFILYQDIYYLYLNFAIPFLSLSFPQIYSYIVAKMKPQRFVIPSIIFVILLINLITYTISYRQMNKIQSPSVIISAIYSENPRVLYGINSLTPALSYLAKKPLLENIIDTNENIFRKGFLDKKELTEKALKNHALIITTGAAYPQIGVEDFILDGIFQKEKILKHCRLVISYPLIPEGIGNRINLFQC